jgi:hypothetical protein
MAEHVSNDGSASKAGSARPTRRDLLVGGGALAVGAGVAAVGMAAPASAVAVPSIPVYQPYGPVRYFDSRDPDGGGPLSNGDAAVIGPTVPPPATEVAWLFNLTVADTTGAGYLAVFSDDLSSWPGNSSINWFESNQIIANNVFTAIGTVDGGVVVLAGGGSTNFVLDLVGKSILTPVSGITSFSTAPASGAAEKGVVRSRYRY